MRLFKKLDRNYKDLSDHDLWNYSRFSKIQEELYSGNIVGITYDFDISMIECIKDKQELTSVLEDNIKNEKKLILLIKSITMDIKEINELQKQFYYNQAKTKKWIYLFDLNSNKFIIPEITVKKFPKSIFDENRRLKSQLSRINYIKPLLISIFSQEIIDYEDQLFDIGKIKEDKITSWKKSLKNEDERILVVTGGRIARSNWKIRSNVTRSKRIIMTEDRIVIAKRKFSLFGLSLGAFIPLIAFVRPSNKIILLFKYLYQYLKLPFELLKGLKPMLPNLLPILVAFSFAVDFTELKLVIDNFFVKFPSLNFISISLNFVISTPEALPAVAGIFTLFRFIFRSTMFRGEELVIIPYDNIRTAFLHNDLLILRMKLKGNDLIRAPENGIEFRFRIRSYSNDIRSSEIAAGMYYNILSKLSEV